MNVMLIVVMIILGSYFALSFIDFKEKINSFKDFLKQQEDFETLEKIGFFTNGEETKFVRKVPFFVIERILEEKYQNSNLIEYLNFSEEQSSYRKKILSILMLLLLLGGILWIRLS